MNCQAFFGFFPISWTRVTWSGLRKSGCADRPAPNLLVGRPPVDQDQNENTELHIVYDIAT